MQIPEWAQKNWYDVTVQQSRADFLDQLYAESGRTNGLYTGLFKEYQQRLEEAGA
jgi:hypothetical protein